MLGVVCIHAFAWTDHVSHGLWALSCPSLAGFIMISGWFGIRFRPDKLLRIIGTVAASLLIVIAIKGEGIIYFLKTIRGYWYVWAYVFVMLLSPIVDGFVENCKERKLLRLAFFSVAGLLWFWCFFSAVGSRFSAYIPSINGFGDKSAIVLFCLYVLMRLMKSLGWIALFSKHPFVVLIVFMGSGIAVYMGFRHIFGFFAFAFACSALLLVRRIPISSFWSRVIAFISPSMFSVYIMHLPFHDSFPGWERAIREVIDMPYGLSQFVLAVLVFLCAVALDMPRRLFVCLMTRLLHHQ